MAKQKRRGRLQLGDDGDTDALFYALIEASAGVIREDGDVTEDEEDGDDTTAADADASADAPTTTDAPTDDRRVAYKAEEASPRSRPERPTTPMRKGKYHQVRDAIPDDADKDGGGNAAANDDDDDAKAAPPAAQDESRESASLVRVRELLGEDW